MIRNSLMALVLAAAFTACSSTDSRPDVQVTPGPHAPVASIAAPVAPVDVVLEQLKRVAPDADPGVLALALEARACALRGGRARAASKLTVIDYTRPSTQPRLWVFDLERNALLYAEHVAHGRGSGENFARAFSNRDGSHQSSLGLFTTGETYDGGNGYSLRMDGLEPGINDAARERLIVMHGAPYVDPAQALRQGRLGRSFGCPALRPQVARAVIDTIKQDQLLFAYYPDDAWLAGSRWFGCSGRSARDILAAARGPDAGGASTQATAAR